MLTAELRAAATKLQREQQLRTEREQQRLEKERILKERAKQKEAQREEAARQRRLAEQAAAEAEEERRLADLEHNRGIHFRTSLAAAPSLTASAIARGIRRAADKLTLPPSIGNDLLSQGAPKNGAMLFELATPNGATTHAGVLEFTAPEGVVLLPEKVANCLWGLERPASTAAAEVQQPASSSSSSSSAALSPRQQQRCTGRVMVSYKRLEKGIFVRFQPATRAFHEQVGADPDLLKEVLEQALLGCCTLSEGDWIQVHHDGTEYDLRVAELQPDRAVSVMDTDMAVEVGPSIETEGYIREREEALAREQERLRQLEEQQEQLAAEALAAAEAAQKAAEAQAAEEAAKRLRVQAEKAALVPEEVEAGSSEPHAVVLVRLPNGDRVVRRCRLNEPVQVMYDFVDSKGAGGFWPDSYQLVQQYPRQVLKERAVTFGDAGLGHGQQAALFVERLEPATAV